MRVCPTCSVAYQDGQSFCPKDGAELEPGPAGAVSETALGPGDVRDTPLADPPAGAIQDPDPLVGRVLGGLYRVLEPIGRGGMGVVYAVEHVHLGKKFALKVLSRTVARNASAIDRLRQEAIAASRIEHENIVDIVSFDTTPQGDVFIVMEYLRGESLARVLERGPLPLARAIEIGVQIARALQAAHDKDIIHRDVKPENVFICQRGSDAIIKVLDFGISKVKDAETERVRMTKTGELVGTPLYMSPEQARGETKLDARTDVYALGVILFEMLTGKTPFTGENYFQLLWKHSNETAPTLGSSRSGLAAPPALEAAVARALAKDPAERFSSMQELEDRLTSIAAQAGLTIPTVRQSLSPTPGVAQAARRPTGKLGLVALAAALAACLGFLLIGRADPPSKPAPTPRRVPEARGLGPSPVVSTQPATRQPARTVVVALASTPTGAEVFCGDRRVGATPTIDRVPRSAQALEYRFALRGFRETVYEVVPSADLAVDVRLQARPRGNTTAPPVGIKGTL
ncbi:MAG: serine/threonine protein kinase [Deltaproteobacteria bacterium]|nr:serine/threonine protein kinase [Deltaproteobacteria bacterium]